MHMNIRMHMAAAKAIKEAKGQPGKGYSAT